MACYKVCKLKTSVRIRILVGDLDRNGQHSQDIPHDIFLTNEYGKTDGFNELKDLLVALGFTKTSVHSVTLSNYMKLLEEFEDYANSLGKEQYLLLNLLDGIETDGYPGVSVIQEIEARSILFTGSDAFFYKATTSKPFLKKILLDKGVSTADFMEIREGYVEEDVAEAEKFLVFPLIVKPSVSYSSVGITGKSIVHNTLQAVQQVRHLLDTMPSCDGVFMEQFLAGREYTALVTGDAANGTYVYSVAERIFSPELKVEQRILAFERYWGGYGLDGMVPDAASISQLYTYQPAPIELQTRLQKLARDAYLALNGNGYGRVDIRSDDMDNSNIFVLEVNANCGVGFGEDSSVGKILAMSAVEPAQFIEDLLTFAFLRKTQRFQPITRDVTKHK